MRWGRLLNLDESAAHFLEQFMSRYRQIVALVLFTGLIIAAPPTAPGQLFPKGAKPKPPVAVTDKNIKEAIQRGIKYLRNSGEGGRSAYETVFPAGYRALMGLAMLEAGVDAEDDFVQETARLIRQANRVNRTYELGLAILFLDRLGVKEDARLIRTFALRLVAGQNTAGGWTYGCPILSVEQEEQLLTFLRTNQPMPDPLRPAEHAFLVPLGKSGAGALASPLPKPGTALANPLPKPGESLADPLNAKDTAPKLLTPLPKNDPPDRKFPAPEGGSPHKPDDAPAEPAKPPPNTKNDKRPSAAAKGKPSELAPPALSGKPAAEPSPKTAADAPPPKPAVAAKAMRIDPAECPSVPEFVAREITKIGFTRLEVDDNSNTQFAILGLWAARRHEVPMALSLAMLDRRFRNSQLANGTWTYAKSGAVFSYDTMTCVGLLALGASHGSFREVMHVEGKQLFADPAVQKALHALGRTMRTPSPEPPNAYLLWSIERVAMLYGLKKIDQQDWYAWGAHALLRTQNADGSWNASHAHGMNLAVNTAMNVLFLSRSHLNRDLTDRLKGFLQVGP